VRLHAFCIYETLKWDTKTTAPKFAKFCFLACTYSSLEAYHVSSAAVCLLAFICLVLSFTHHCYTLPLDRRLDLSMSGNTQMVMHGWAISAFDYDFDGQQRTDVVIITRMASKRNTTTT
jgi:hypothetical protein